jgi:hypothetical protein
LNGGPESVIGSDVKRLTAFVAAALLVIWIPATSLCAAENAGLIPSSGCCDDSPAAAEAPCCALASAAYKFDGSSQVILGPPLAMSIASTDLGTSDSGSSPGTRIETDVSPPELCHTWQFIARAAASPRAPSLAS